jgi:hypothetical protein
MSLVLVLVIIIFDAVNNDAVVSAVFTVAGYTYGPLLGLYAFGLFTPFSVKDRMVPFLAVLSPVLCYVLSANSVEWFNGYKFGFELLILNGLIMFLGMLLFNNGRAERHKF